MFFRGTIQSGLQTNQCYSHPRELRTNGSMELHYYQCFIASQLPGVFVGFAHREPTVIFCVCVLFAFVLAALVATFGRRLFVPTTDGIECDPEGSQRDRSHSGVPGPPTEPLHRFFVGPPVGLELVPIVKLGGRDSQQKDDRVGDQHGFGAAHGSVVWFVVLWYSIVGVFFFCFALLCNVLVALLLPVPGCR